MSSPFDPQQSPPPGGEAAGSYDNAPQPRLPGAGQAGPQWEYGQGAPPSQPYWPGQSGQFGQPPAPYPYGTPAAPSQPYPGYQTIPSQLPYGYSADPSQPLQGQPGQWAPAPYSQPGMMGLPKPPRKSRRGLWIGLGVALALLILAGGGLGFVVIQYAAPTAAALTFCADLKAQNYSSAYGGLSSSLRGEFTQDQFYTVSKQLDTIEGPVTVCAAASGSTALHYSLGSSTAVLTVVITRSTAGSLQGNVDLRSENGVWKVNGLDTSLLGVNLSALVVTSTLCQDLQAQKYADAYALLSPSTQAAVKAADYAQQAQLHDQVDGTITSCTLVGLGSGNSDTAAVLIVAVARSRLGNEQGSIQLVVDGTTWKVSQVAKNVQGSDLGPLLVGNTFCAALKKGDYATAYGTLSASQKAQGSEADFATALTLPSPDKWNGCTPDYTTYKVTGSSASYNAGLGFLDTSSGQSASIAITMTFVNEGGSWKLDNFAKA